MSAGLTEKVLSPNRKSYLLRQMLHKTTTNSRGTTRHNSPGRFVFFLDSQEKCEASGECRKRAWGETYLQILLSVHRLESDRNWEGGRSVYPACTRNEKALSLKKEERARMIRPQKTQDTIEQIIPSILLRLPKKRLLHSSYD